MFQKLNLKCHSLWGVIYSHFALSVTAETTTRLQVCSSVTAFCFRLYSFVRWVWGTGKNVIKRECIPSPTLRPHTRCYSERVRNRQREMDLTKVESQCFTFWLSSILMQLFFTHTISLSHSQTPFWLPQNLTVTNK